MSGDLRHKEEKDREMGCTFPENSIVKCSGDVQHTREDLVWLKPKVCVGN